MSTSTNKDPRKRSRTETKTEPSKKHQNLASMGTHTPCPEDEALKEELDMVTVWKIQAWLLAMYNLVVVPRGTHIYHGSKAPDVPELPFYATHGDWAKMFGPTTFWGRLIRDALMLDLRVRFGSDCLFDVDGLNYGTALMMKLIEDIHNIVDEIASISEQEKLHNLINGNLEELFTWFPLIDGFLVDDVAPDAYLDVAGHHFDKMLIASRGLVKKIMVRPSFNSYPDMLRVFPTEPSSVPFPRPAPTKEQIDKFHELEAKAIKLRTPNKDLKKAMVVYGNRSRLQQRAATQVMKISGSINIVDRAWRIIGKRNANVHRNGPELTDEEKAQYNTYMRGAMMSMFPDEEDREDWSAKQPDELFVDEDMPEDEEDYEVEEWDSDEE